jgi:hypothetical protein
VSLPSHSRRATGAGLAVVGAVALLNLVWPTGTGPVFDPGPIAMFAVGALGALSALGGLLLVPVRGLRNRTTARLLSFGATLLVGFGPLYLVFGCVLAGCPG